MAYRRDIKRNFNYLIALCKRIIINDKTCVAAVKDRFKKMLEKLNCKT